jgi:hypothetical protein
MGPKDRKCILIDWCIEAWLVSFQAGQMAVLGYVKAYQCLVYVQPPLIDHLY